MGKKKNQYPSDTASAASKKSFLVTVANFNSQPLTLDLVGIFGLDEEDFDFLKVFLSTTQGGIHKLRKLPPHHPYSLPYKEGPGEGEFHSLPGHCMKYSYK